MISLVRNPGSVPPALTLSVDQLVENMHQGVMITDASGIILTVNAAFTKITGHKKEDIIGENPRVLHSGRQGKEFYKTMWKTLQTQGVWQGEIWNRRKNGEIYPEWLIISTIKGKNGEADYFMGVFSDISSQKVSEAWLSHLAYHDALTGLPNRQLFQDRLSQAIAQAPRNHKHIALLFIDLDGFKPINDCYGHDVGDLLLKSVASRLLGCIRKGDTVARLGGDEFVAIISSVTNQKGVVRAANEILEAIAQPFHLVKDKDFCLTASIGISMFPQDGKDVAHLLKRADAAMYEAKNTGRNKFVFFSHSH